MVGSDREALLAVRGELNKVLQDVPAAEGSRAYAIAIQRSLNIIDAQLQQHEREQDNAQPKTLAEAGLPSFEENLARFGTYNNRPDKKESAVQFLERCWGSYLDRFNGGKGDFLYQDQLKSIDDKLLKGIHNWTRANGGKASDYIAEKSVRVKKETKQLIDAVNAVESELQMRGKLYRLQKALVDKNNTHRMARR